MGVFCLTDTLQSDRCCFFVSETIQINCMYTNIQVVSDSIIVREVTFAIGGIFFASVGNVGKCHQIPESFGDYFRQLISSDASCISDFCICITFEVFYGFLDSEEF